MRGMTREEMLAIDRRVIEVLRGLQLYDSHGAVDGAFAEDVAALAGFVRGEIREAVYLMTAARPAATEVAKHHTCGAFGPNPHEHRYHCPTCESKGCGVCEKRQRSCDLPCGCPERSPRCSYELPPSPEHTEEQSPMKTPVEITKRYDPISRVTDYSASCLTPLAPQVRLASYNLPTEERAIEVLRGYYAEYMARDRAREEKRIVEVEF